MLKRLPYKDILFEQLSFLEPKVALYNESRSIKDLSYIARCVENIDLSKLSFEWRVLPTVFSDSEKINLALLEIDEMWAKILEFKDVNKEKMFPNLELLIETVLSFPHSNAEAERIFSMVTDIKNKKRNRLDSSTLSAMCIVRSSFQTENVNCTNFETDARHLELHTSQNLHKK